MVKVRHHISNTIAGVLPSIPAQSAPRYPGTTAPMVPVKAVSPVVVVTLVMVDPRVSRVVMDPAAPSRWVHQAQV